MAGSAAKVGPQFGRDFGVNQARPSAGRLVTIRLAEQFVQLVGGLKFLLDFF